MNIETLTSAWYKEELLELRIPDKWEIEEVKINTHKLNAITRKFFTAFDSPIGTDPLFKLIQDKKIIAIVTDDISRPTPTDVIIPLLLKYIKNRSNCDPTLLIISASGTHQPMSKGDMILKYGSHIPEVISVHVHNSMGKKSIKYLGKSKHGTPVYINKLAADADLIISVGGIYPAPPIGFSGGPKIMLGISGIKTIKYLHYGKKGIGLGSIENCSFKDELFYLSNKIGLKFIINVLITHDRKISEVFAGDPKAAYDKGTQAAQRECSVLAPINSDVVMANTYPFDTSLVFSRKGWWPLSYTKENGLKIIISAASQGIGNHGLWPFIPRKNEKLIRALDYFRTFSLSEMANKLMKRMSKKMGNYDLNGRINGKDDESKHPILFFSPHNDFHSLRVGNLLFFNSWDKLLEKAFDLGFNRKLKGTFYHSSSLVYPKSNE